MQINRIGISNQQFNFKANYFTIDKNGKDYDIVAISTDNSENLGNEPVLEYYLSNEKYENPMMYDGKFYTTMDSIVTNKYRIFYKDTGKYERDGKEQVINSLYYTKIVTSEDRKYNKIPLEQSIAKGEFEGKVFVNTLDIPEDVPAILILDEVRKEEDLILNIPKNVKSIIVSSAKMSTLDHIANLTRNKYHVFSIVWDENKFNDLKKQSGKYLSLNNESGILNYEEIQAVSSDSESINSKLFTPKVEVPKLENVERLLTFDELTPQNCGNKGYKIGVMQKLVKEGILKNITIPNGFVIPEGYINKYNEYINVEDEEEWKRRIVDGIYTQDTENKIKELGLPRRNLIIRSNFNSEDLRSFSSAGIYESKVASPSTSVIDEAIWGIIKYSLEATDLAKNIHKKYGIEDKDIQPSVIIQECIDADYGYTIYSDDGENNIIIDLSDYELGYSKPTKALIKYNKKNKELTIDKYEPSTAEYLINENGKIIDQIHPSNRVKNNWDVLLPLFSIIASGALVLENFFKHPQDIEGGIGKDGKVYFWQTRDIVAKAVKRI